MPSIGALVSFAQTLPGRGAPRAAPAGSPVSHGSPASAPAPPQPWIIEGDSLWGSRDVGTEILHPTVQQGSLLIQAIQGRLNPPRTIVTLTDQVRIRDSLRVINADQGTYRRIDRVLDLVGNVVGFGPEGEMRAGSLNYDRVSGLLLLRDDPRLLDSLRVIRAEEIVYDASRDYAEATGTVRILLRADSTWLNSERATYDRRTGQMVLTGNPWLFRPGIGVESDLTVHADTLRMNEVQRIGEASGNVRIERGEVRALSETASFELVRNVTTLYGNPVALDPDGEIRADTMMIRMVPNGPDVLRAFGSVTAQYRPRERPGESNVVTGDTLRAALSGSTITDLEMHGNAVSLLLPTLADARRGSGRNVSRADHIRVDLENGEARRVELVSNASGTYLYPGDRAMRDLRDREFLDSLFFAIDYAAVRASYAEVDSMREAMGLPARAGADTSTVGADSLHLGAATDSLDRPSGPAFDPARNIMVPGDDGELTDYANRRYGERPLPVEHVIRHFLRARNLDLPDSLIRPFDRLFGERVDYSGDTIRFYVPEDRIALRGNGVLEYGGNGLESEEIDYDAQKELVTALGDPTLRDANTKVVGTRMLYRTDEREGMVYQGRTEFEGGRYFGEQIKKRPNDDLLVREGDYTTCDHDPPHYHFHSSRMKMVMDDKVIARPVVLYIRDIPVFGIPYYFFPLDHGRRSGILFPDLEFGFNQNRGRFINNLGYYWAISDYMDAKAWMDYFDEGPEFRLGGQYRYNVRYLLNGYVEGTWLESRSETGKTNEWNLSADHDHDLWENGRLSATAELRSSAQYLNDYDFGAGVDERLTRQLRSTLGFSQRWTSSSLSVSAQRTEYLDQTTGNGLKLQADAPSIDYRINSFSLGSSGDEYRSGRLPFLSSTYVTLSSAFRSQVRTPFGEKAETNQAARGSWSLSDTRPIGPFLKLSPGLSGDVAWFAEDLAGDRNTVGATWRGNLRAGSTVYGTLGDVPGPVEGLRHVIEPSVSWSYTPQIRSLSYSDSSGVRRPRIPNVGGISLSSAKSSRLTFSLSQRFHLKWKQGEEVLKKENLLTWDASSSYDLLARDETRPMSNISNSFRFRPLRTFDGGTRLEFDPYDWVRRSYSVDLNLNLNSTMFQRQSSDTTGAESKLEYGEFGNTELRGANIGNRYNEGRVDAPPIPWNLSLSYRLSGSRGSSFKSHTLGLNGGFTPTANWVVGAGAQYNLEDEAFVSHEFQLSRDLHCWELTFSYRSPGTYLFHVGIRDIPEVKYESRR